MFFSVLKLFEFQLRDFLCRVSGGELRELRKSSSSSSTMFTARAKLPAKESSEKDLGMIPSGLLKCLEVSGKDFCVLPTSRFPQLFFARCFSFPSLSFSRRQVAASSSSSSSSSSSFFLRNLRARVSTAGDGEWWRQKGPTNRSPLSSPLSL